MWKETWKSLTNALKDWKTQPEQTPTLNLKYFKLSEFKCRCCGSTIMKEDFLRKLDRARGIAKIPFTVLSGYRCEKHNKAIGALPTSSHIKGCAADIHCVDSADRYRIMISCMACGIKRIGIYRTFIHVDTDAGKPSRLIWYGE